MHRIGNAPGNEIGHQYKAIGWIAACFFPGMFLVLGITQKRYVSAISWVLFLVVAAAFGGRFTQEYRILKAPMNAVAIVTTLCGKPLEAGYVYSVRYRFTAEDGKDYIGGSGWTSGKKFAEGEPLEMLYRRTDPSHNLPVSDFRLYEIRVGSRL